MGLSQFVSDISVDQVPMQNNSFSSRVTDVGNEKLNFIGPIDNLFSVDNIPFEETLIPLHPTNPNLFKHSTFSKLFAEDILSQEVGNFDQNGLMEGEIAAINLYTREWDSSIYRKLNEVLRKEDRSELKGWFPFLRLLVSGLSKIKNFKGCLWRGIRDVDLHPKYKKTGNKFFWWGFSSCTKQLEVLQSIDFLGESGKRILFKIEATNGVDIQKYSSIPNEVEVLLLPGTYFEVIGIFYAVGSKPEFWNTVLLPKYGKNIPSTCTHHWYVPNRVDLSEISEISETNTSEDPTTLGLPWPPSSPSMDHTTSVCAKLGDFGTAVVMDTMITGRFVDNPVWLAPEILSNHPYDYKVDTYAFGVILWELLSPRFLWSSVLCRTLRNSC